MARVLTREEPSFVLPIDDALISGPSFSLIEPRALVSHAKAGGASSVLGYPGVLRRCTRELAGMGFVQNVTASTTLSYHTTKVCVAGIEDAVRNGADAVAAHINLSADSEPQMLIDLGRIGEQCREVGMPLVVIAYPRRDGPEGDDNYFTLRDEEPAAYAALVSRCARVAIELGADAVKVPYTGSPETFSEVVACSMGIPVLVAGGQPKDDPTAIQIATDAIRAGAAGVAYGRQTFMHEISEVEDFIDKVVTAMRNVWTGAMGGALADLSHPQGLVDTV
jgi:DhnA family fructose-bisphosphate aldolase class Ia